MLLKCIQITLGFDTNVLLAKNRYSLFPTPFPIHIPIARAQPNPQFSTKQATPLYPIIRNGFLDFRTVFDPWLVSAITSSSLSVDGIRCLWPSLAVRALQLTLLLMPEKSSSAMWCRYLHYLLMSLQRTVSILRDMAFSIIHSSIGDPNLLGSLHVGRYPSSQPARKPSRGIADVCALIAGKVAARSVMT